MFKSINTNDIPPPNFTITSILKINILIYVSTNGAVYKSNGTDAFTAMTGTSGEIWSLAVDSNNNIYAGEKGNTKPSIFISQKF